MLKGYVHRGNEVKEYRAATTYRLCLLKKFSNDRRVFPTISLVSIVLFASWMGNTNGGYFVGEWSLVALTLAIMMLVTSMTGVLGSTSSKWVAVTIIFFALYTTWTFLSLLWSPNRGDAWLGSGQTLLYLLAFWISVSLVTLGASRRWALIASVLAPAIIATFTLLALPSHMQELFENSRLVGSVGYYNGEAAFLLVPLWVGVYLGGSKLINPVVRGLVLAGAVVSVEVAVLTQSRGAMVAGVVSLPVFFVLSGQRLRGLLALGPVAIALFIAFPDLNNVYLEFLNKGSAAGALDRVVLTVWATAAGAGLYGLAWGLLDRLWEPSTNVVRAAGGIVLASSIVVVLVGVWVANERVGTPIAWGGQKWEEFKTDDRSGQEQSRYLSASGTGRYTLWQVAWQDFASQPAIGVGTHNYEATYYQLRERSVGFVRQPHTLPLEVLAERGIVGGVLFFGLLATCLVGSLWKRIRALNAEGKGQVGAMVAAVTYWLVHSSADWFWQIPAVTLPAMAYLAMLVAPWSNREPVPCRWSLRLVGAGIAVLAIAAVAPLYIADRYLTQSYATANPWIALTAVERAQNFDPVDPYLPQREAELALQIGDWPRAEAAYRKAIGLNPEHYAAYDLLAFFYEKGGNPEKALSFYRKALTLNPLDKELERRVARLEAKAVAMPLPTRPYDYAELPPSLAASSAAPTGSESPKDRFLFSCRNDISSPRPL